MGLVHVGSFDFEQNRFELCQFYGDNQWMFYKFQRPKISIFGYDIIGSGSDGGIDKFIIINIF